MVEVDKQGSLRAKKWHFNELEKTFVKVSQIVVGLEIK